MGGQAQRDRSPAEPSSLPVLAVVPKSPGFQALALLLSLSGPGQVTPCHLLNG